MTSVWLFQLATFNLSSACNRLFRSLNRSKHFPVPWIQSYSLVQSYLVQLISLVHKLIFIYSGCRNMQAILALILSKISSRYSRPSHCKLKRNTLQRTKIIAVSGPVFFSGSRIVVHLLTDSSQSHEDASGLHESSETMPPHEAH